MTTLSPRYLRGNTPLPPGMEHYATNAVRAIVFANSAARQNRSSVISSKHLLIGILQLPHSAARDSLAQLGVSIEDLQTEIEVGLDPLSHGAERFIPFTENARRVLDQAEESLESERTHLDVGHLLQAIVDIPECSAAKTLARYGVTSSNLQPQVSGFRSDRVARYSPSRPGPDLSSR